MSITAPSLRAGTGKRSTRSSLSGIRTYFFSDSRRAIQTALGLIWLLDGALQFQPFMYGKGFIQMITGLAAGQPGWVHDSVLWAASTTQSDQTLWNTLFALTQVAIGVGLLWRPAVKPALAISFVWTLVVWWFGEAFGMLFMTMAQPLTGAPGAVLLYALVGLVVWPGERPGGLVGVRGARLLWGGLWTLMAWLWLEAPSSSANAISNAIKAAPSGMSWLSTVQDWATTATRGAGLPLAMMLAAVSLAVGLAVASNWRARPFLLISIALSLAFWVFGQGLGGVFQGGATDLNAGPLFILMACAMLALVPYRTHTETLAGSRPGGLLLDPMEKTR